MSEESFLDVLRKANERTKENVDTEIGVGWHVYNEDLKKFEEYFGYFCPQEFERLGEYIESSLADKRGDVRAVELGGPGSKLFNGFSPGFIGKSLGVILMEDPERDVLRQSNHDIITGDITKQISVKKIEDWLDGEKIDILFERMVGGIKEYPEDPRFLWSMLARYYPLMSENSMLFAQLPTILESETVSTLHNWASKVSDDKLLVKLAINKVDHADFILHLHKMAGAPTALPK